MKRYAPAKVNIALDVLGVDARGYHDLDMIMAPVSLFDEVEIEPAARGRGGYPGDSSDWHHTGR